MGSMGGAERGNLEGQVLVFPPCVVLPPPAEQAAEESHLLLLPLAFAGLGEMGLQDAGCEPGMRQSGWRGARGSGRGVVLSLPWSTLPPPHEELAPPRIH